MTMTFKETREKAMAAYLAVWRESGIRWCPPPTEMRDKKWSAKLREAWPELTRVEIPTKTVKDHFFEMKKWCNEHPSAFWTNGGGNIWYFERRDIAALFKLTFGGVQ